MMSPRDVLQWGAINGLLAVLAGAFAAHGLKAWLPAELLAVWQTGAQYQEMHASALLAVGLLTLLYPSPTGEIAAWLFLAGILLLSGSLYLLAFTGQHWLGAPLPRWVGPPSSVVGWRFWWRPGMCHRRRNLDPNLSNGSQEILGPVVVGGSMIDAEQARVDEFCDRRDVVPIGGLVDMTLVPIPSGGKAGDGGRLHEFRFLDQPIVAEQIPGTPRVVVASRDLDQTPAQEALVVSGLGVAEAVLALVFLLPARISPDFPDIAKFPGFVSQGGKKGGLSKQARDVKTGYGGHQVIDKADIPHPYGTCRYFSVICRPSWNIW
ncbi:membrane hypothetical protein [Gammaproteobacteria bacterium]